MRGNRRERRNVKAIYGTLYMYEANEEWNQYFCETEKAWELWGPSSDKNGLPRMIQRWPKSRIWMFLEY